MLFKPKNKPKKHYDIIDCSCGKMIEVADCGCGELVATKIIENNNNNSSELNSIFSKPLSCVCGCCEP